MALYHPLAIFFRNPPKVDIKNIIRTTTFNLVTLTFFVITKIPVIQQELQGWYKRYIILLRVTMHAAEEEVDTEVGDQYRYKCHDTEDVEKHRTAEQAKG